MTIIYRSVKGSNLDATEVDNNFHDVDDRIQAIEDNPPEPLNISNMTVVGTQWTIYLEDATVFGPFTLPQANFRPSVVATIDEDTDGIYAPVLADANGYKRYAGSSDLTVLMPLNADVAYPIDSEITFRQAGDGAIIFDTATAGPTLNGIVGFLNRTGVGGATVTLKKVATDEWDLIGLLAEDVTA
ncbi:MAG: hypothetical protein EOS73_26285 [Mesorhizobium sp.]|uniref:hypothetical protein n=1 Tax=Mesorhizobium sp. M7A.F.Ca.ET.027.02.1.1 TaxID=2496655 RepID=UPI000FD4B794|nr:hypothetical protein [Mesorhizobium sp. M7A.F.Ca.ET.027.02.1.1]RVD13020.1 hypothetical protein EN749_25140 [Mesorhizobium sp. M7A.F.Ca.ET.027.02.1.1]RWC99955.1 MAG: hypothetical protein EOS73_26285 [Mesorhizobium sp.]